MCEYIILKDNTMEKYIYNESTGLWYELHGDYYFPCLTLPEKEQQPVGLWGSNTNSISKSIEKQSAPQ